MMYSTAGCFALQHIGMSKSKKDQDVHVLSEIIQAVTECCDIQFLLDCNFGTPNMESKNWVVNTFNTFNSSGQPSCRQICILQAVFAQQIRN